MAATDHLVYAVTDLAAAIDWFEAGTGVRPAIGGRHEGRGTHNALVSLGECYLELIAPDPDQPDPVDGRPFGIDDLDGHGLVGFAVRPSEEETMDDLIDRAVASGYDPGDVAAMSRATPDGEQLNWRLTFPHKVTLPFIIDWADTTNPCDTAPGGVVLDAFEIIDPRPFDVMATFAAIGLDATVRDGAPAALSATITGPGGTLIL